MIITKRKGNRGICPEGDWIFQITTKPKEEISYEDLFIILANLFENEERIYPQNKGYMGKHLLYSAIFKLFNKEKTPEELTKYMNTKGKSKKDLTSFGFNPSDWKKCFCDSCGNEAYCQTCKKYIWQKTN